MAQALASQTCGFNLYSLLPQGLANAFPRWDWEGDVGDLTDDLRKIMKSKIWRAKVYSSSPFLVTLASGVTLSAEAIDHLGMRLQLEGEKGGVLISILFEDERNPFVEAQLTYCRLLTQPPSHTLFQLLFHFRAGALSPQGSLALMLMQINLTFSAWVWYMCERALREYPYPLAALGHPAFPDQHGVCQKFIDAHDCDVDPGMGEKIRAKHKTVASLMGDIDLREGIKLWANSAIENMCMERLLALFKKSAGAGVPSCERLVSAGLLAQPLAAHRTAGGREPSQVTRKDLIEHGAPIASNAPAVAERARLPPEWMRRAQEKIKRRRSIIGKVSRAQYNEELRCLAAECKTSHDDQLPAAPAPQGQGNADAEVGVDQARRYEMDIGSSLWGLSSLSQPIRGDVVDAQALMLGSAGGGREGERKGLTAYKDILLTWSGRRSKTTRSAGAAHAEIRDCTAALRIASCALCGACCGHRRCPMSAKYSGRLSEICAQYVRGRLWRHCGKHREESSVRRGALRLVRY